MEIKQLEPKDKVLTFFGEFKSATVESAIKEIVKILSVGIESPSGPYFQHYGAVTEDTDTIHFRIMERIVWPQDSHYFLYAFYSGIQHLKFLISLHCSIILSRGQPALMLKELVLVKKYSSSPQKSILCDLI